MYQWINIFIMSPEQDTDPIEALLEDLTDCDKFHGITTDNIFDTASIYPIKHKSTMVSFKTSLSLHRDCKTWDSIAL